MTGKAIVAIVEKNLLLAKELKKIADKNGPKESAVELAGGVKWVNRIASEIAKAAKREAESNGAS